MYFEAWVSLHSFGTKSNSEGGGGGGGQGVERLSQGENEVGSLPKAIVGTNELLHWR